MSYNQSYQTQQLVETVIVMMVMAMGVGMVAPIMLQKGKQYKCRAREIAMNVITTLSQKYATPKPRIIFMPMEETEAHFREPSTIQISDTFGKIVDTAKADEWDKFLRAVIAHEFKHYLQYQESGRLFKTIPEEEYEPLEREAWRFGLEFGGISLEEFSKMRAMASSIGVLYFVEGMSMEKSIQVAKAEFPIV